MEKDLGGKDYTFKEYQFEEAVNNSGVGVMGLNEGVPYECMNFVRSQFERFRVPVTERVWGLIENGAQYGLCFIDYDMPYALYWGLSDVEMTDDWRNYSFHLFDSKDSIGYEANPEYLETFTYVPGQSDRVFQHIMANPSLKDIPEFGEELYDRLDEYLAWSCPELVSEYLPAVEEMFGEESAAENARAYFEMAAWAAIAWICGPYSREYRKDANLIFDVCEKYGEAILYEGQVIAPANYRRVNRAPESCHRCGINSWCTESTLEGDTVVLICEACQNGSLPRLTELSCGTKVSCKYTGCPHHPLHYRGAGAFREAMNKHGQLNAVARGEAPLGIKGRESLFLT